MLPEEVRKLIGQLKKVRIFQVEKGAIRRYADAVDDQNPLWQDEEYARKSRYGSIIAPPAFFGWPAKWPKKGPLFDDRPAEIEVALEKVGYTGGFDGGVEFEFFSPARPGDTLTATSVIKDLIEREGKRGSLVFVITETTYINQNGDLVAKARASSARIKP